MKITTISFKSSLLPDKNKIYTSHLAPAINKQAETVVQSNIDKNKTLKIAASVFGGLLAIAALLNIKNISKVFIKENKSIFPKYLYHMTSEDNYNKIIQSRLLKRSEIDDSVYLFDVKNLISSSQQNKLSSMIKWYAGTHPQNNAPRFSNRNVVILKIAVDDLSNNNLSLRSIGRINYADDDIIPRQPINELKKNLNHFKELQNFPLEYLYSENIPTSKITLLNKVDVGLINENEIVPQFFRKMFLNTSEEEIINSKFAVT